MIIIFMMNMRVFNFTTLLPKYKNRRGFPIYAYIMMKELLKLKQKKFKQINRRDNFLIYLKHNCVPERDLFFKADRDKKHMDVMKKSVNNIQFEE